MKTICRPLRYRKKIKNIWFDLFSCILPFAWKEYWTLYFIDRNEVDVAGSSVMMYALLTFFFIICHVLMISLICFLKAILWSHHLKQCWNSKLILIVLLFVLCVNIDQLICPLFSILSIERMYAGCLHHPHRSEMLFYGMKTVCAQRSVLIMRQNYFLILMWWFFLSEIWHCSQLSVWYLGSWNKWLIYHESINLITRVVLSWIN